MKNYSSWWQHIHCSSLKAFLLSWQSVLSLWWSVAGQRWTPGRALHTHPAFFPPFDDGLPWSQIFQIAFFSQCHIPGPRRGAPSPPVFFLKASRRLVFVDYFAMFPVCSSPGRKLLVPWSWCSCPFSTFVHIVPLPTVLYPFSAPHLFTSDFSLCLTPKPILTLVLHLLWIEYFSKHLQILTGLYLITSV